MRRKLLKTMFSVALAVCLMGNTVSASELGTTETEEVSEPVMEDSEAEIVDVSAGDAAQESAVEEYTVEEHTEEIPVEGATTGLTYTVEGDTVTITGKGECWTSGSEIKKAITNAKHVVFRDCKIIGSMRWAFYECSNLQSIDLSGLDTSLVLDMGLMFYGCESLTSLDVSGFDTSKVTYMDWMFEGCSNLTSLDVSGFDTFKVTDMGFMFSDCSGLKTLDVSGFDTSKVTDMSFMFFDCSGLMNLDIGEFNASNTTEVEGMLMGCRPRYLHTPKVLPAGCQISLDRIYQNPDGVKTGALTPEFAGTTLTLYIPPVDEQFTDVPTGAWYVSAVQYAYDNGIMTGKTETTFAPNANLTRAEFATVLYSQAGKPAVTYRPIFRDVAQGAWYTSAVLWAYDNGIVSGYANGSFGTSDKITREQLALMMYKYAQTKGYDTTADDSILSSFSDEAAISSWARKAIQWAASHGIMSGKGKGADGKPMLDPKGNATRAECAAMIKKLFTME